MKKSLKKILIILTLIIVTVVGSVVGFFCVENKDQIQDWAKGEVNVTVDEHNQLIFELSKKEDEVNSLHEEINSLRVNFDELNSRLDILLANSEENAEEISAIKLQLEMISSQIESLEIRIADLEKSIKEMQSEIRNLHKSGILVYSELDYGFTITNSERELGSFDVETHGGDLLVLADVTAKINSQTGHLCLYIDGNKAADVWFDAKVEIINRFVHYSITDLPAGSHTIKIIAQASSGTMELMPYNRSMCTIIEL